MKISEVTLDELTLRGRDLFQKHFDEMYFITGSMGPDFENMYKYYKILEDKEKAYFFLASNDDEVFGYAAYIKEAYPLTPKEYCARMDNIYLEEEYRKKGLGEKFINSICNKFKKKKFKGVIHHVRPQVDHSESLIKNKFELMSTSYIRRL